MKMESKVEWLKSGIFHGHLTTDEAFEWLDRRVAEKAPAKERRAAPVRERKADNVPRVMKKDLPNGKPGRMPTNLPIYCLDENGQKVPAKKDGTPRAKPGRKPKQAPIVSATAPELSASKPDLPVVENN